MTKRIVWDEHIWKKLSREFARISVQLSQGGKKPGFSTVMGEAQGILPKKQRRGYIKAFAHCPDGFRQMVEAEIKKLTAIKTNGTNDDHENVNGIDIKPLEIAVSPSMIGYVIPPGGILASNFRKDLIKAGFKFEKIEKPGDVSAMVNKGVQIHSLAEMIVE